MARDTSLDGILTALARSGLEAATVEALLAVACQLLAEHAAQSGSQQMAAERFAAFEATARDAYRRYPVVAGSSFHGGRPDLRPAMHFQSVSLLRNAGAYLPADLDRMTASGEVSPEWADGEAARLVVLLALAGIAVDAMAGGHLAAAAYRETMIGLVRRLGSVTMPHQRHP